MAALFKNISVSHFQLDCKSPYLSHQPYVRIECSNAGTGSQCQLSIKCKDGFMKCKDIVNTSRKVASVN